MLAFARPPLQKHRGGACFLCPSPFCKPPRQAEEEAEVVRRTESEEFVLHRTRSFGNCAAATASRERPSGKLRWVGRRLGWGAAAPVGISDGRLRCHAAMAPACCALLAADSPGAWPKPAAGSAAVPTPAGARASTGRPPRVSWCTGRTASPPSAPPPCTSSRPSRLLATRSAPATRQSRARAAALALTRWVRSGMARPLPSALQ